MSELIDDSLSNLKPEDEVKKLQDLVKKLEKQNELLRNRQNEQEKDNKHESCAAHNNEVLKTQLSNVTTNNSNINDNDTSLLDHVDLLDVTDITTDDEEDKCLYSSPKRPSAVQRTVSPQLWVREEFENPSPEVESAKKSLLYKLDEVSLSRSSSAGTLSSLSSSSTLITSPLKPVALFPTPKSAHQVTGNTTQPAIRKPVQQGHRPDTGTFTRPKKTKSNGVNNSSSFSSADDVGDEIDGGSIPSPLHAGQINTGTFRPKKSLIGSGSGTIRISKTSTKENDGLNRPNIDDIEHSAINDIVNGEEEMSGASSESLHHLEDVTDVQILARMQEESLRRSFSAPRKSLARMRKKPGLSDSDGFLSPHGSARSSPGRFDGDLQVYRSNSSLTSSNSSSPVESPHGSHQNLNQESSRPSVPETERRSMPNLARSNLNRSTGLSTPARSNPQGGTVQAPQAKSVARRMISPQRSGIPSPRSTGIPRPGSASKLPSARKTSLTPSTGLTVPGNLPRRATAPRLNDDSWRDGCY